MPRIWNRSKQRVRTAFSELLADYLDTHWPMRPSHLAAQIPVSTTTILRYLNEGVVTRDPHILERINEVTGIPLDVLYRAAGIRLPAIVTPSPTVPEPPVARDHERRRQRRQIAEHADPAAEVNEYVRRIRASGLPPDLEQVLIDTTVTRMTGLTPEQFRWQQRLREEHDQDAIGTLQLPAVASPALSAAVSAAEPPAVEPQRTRESVV